MGLQFLLIHLKWEEMTLWKIGLQRVSDVFTKCMKSGISKFSLIRAKTR